MNACTYRFATLATLLLLSLSKPAAAFAGEDVDSLLRESADFRQRGQLTSAYDSAKKALKTAKGACEACQRAMVDLQLQMDRPHDAAETAAAWAAHATSPTEKATARYEEAQALVLEDHAKHNDALLKRASQSLAEAATEDPANAGVRLLQGRVLAAMKRDAEARSAFEACRATPGASSLQCRRAEAYLNDIALTREVEAPAFTATRSDGSTVTLDSLAGKVVLIDFWATWCGPCQADRGYVQSIAAEYQESQFVLLGISGDERESVWSKYVEENRMHGIQVRDNRRALQDLFHVSGIPTYILLDGNGIIRFRTTGALKDLRSKVRELVAPSGTVASAAAGK